MARPAIARRTTAARRTMPLMVAATALIAAGGVAAAGPAAASPPGPSSQLVCSNGQTYTVVGWARGLPFHVLGSTSRFIVTRAVMNGEVVLDSPAKADRPLVTCTTVSPLPPGNSYTFTGFFTPPRA